MKLWISAQRLPPIAAIVSGAAVAVMFSRVKFGIETASMYEVVSGLNEGDLVMLGNAAQATPGQKVEPRITTPLARQ